MCMVENAEPCEFTRKRISVARKEHKCNECRRPIAAGETYECVTGKFDLKMFVNKTCSHCVGARSWLRRECGGFCWGAVLQDLEEHWNEEGIHTMELGRLIVGMRRRWSKKRKLEDAKAHQNP